SATSISALHFASRLCATIATLRLSNIASRAGRRGSWVRGCIDEKPAVSRAHGRSDRPSTPRPARQPPPRHERWPERPHSACARGVVSFQASSAAVLAISASRRSAGSLCTTPPGTRRLLIGSPRFPRDARRGLPDCKDDALVGGAPALNDAA